jgi:hypothetical protein
MSLANRAARRLLATDKRSSTWSKLFAISLRGVSRSALGAAGVALMIYLALTPSRINRYEDADQIALRHAQNPDGFYGPMAEIRQQLKSDVSFMTPLRKAAAAKFNVKSAELDTD